MKCLAVTHIAFEDLGSFAAPIRARGYEIDYRHAGAEPPAPQQWRDADLVVVLGGPLGVNDVADYPWLAGEIAGLRERLGEGGATLGICLGAQLMAAALGGSVAPRAAGTEIGWGPLRLHDAGGVLAPLDGVSVLHWHGDNIVLPRGVDALASTDGTPVQAFAVGSHALALQCHPEFEPGALERWLAGHAVELHHAGVRPDALRDGTARHGSALVEAGRAAIGAWLDRLPSQP